MKSTKVIYRTASQPLTIFHPTDCCRSSSPVAVSVTADVHVYRYDGSQSSADESSSRVMVVTSLSAIVKELSSAAVLSKGDEYLVGPSEAPSVSFEIHSQPRVRPSKKGTCLIKADLSQVDVQTSISRMVLLPYPGCSADARLKTARRKNFIKSSKTWERVRVPGSLAVGKRARSQTLRPPPSGKLPRPAVGRGSRLNWLDSDSFSPKVDSGSENLDRASRRDVTRSLSESQVLFKDEESRMYLCSLLNDPRKRSASRVKSQAKSDAPSVARVRSQAKSDVPSAPRVKSQARSDVLSAHRAKSPARSNLSSAPRVKSQARFDAASDARIKFQPVLLAGVEDDTSALDQQAIGSDSENCVRNLSQATVNPQESSDMAAHLAGFDAGIFGDFSGYSLPKSTRNVSILHRPRTRTKATSTSSLDVYFDQKRHLDDPVKRALTPYIAAGNYPSELVLKLVPRKKIEEELKKMEHETDHGSSRHHSEVDLLAPKLDVKVSESSKKGPKTKKSSKKKGKHSSWWGCFSNPKKVESESDSESDGSVVTKVYYPSIVEVHEGGHRKIHVDERDLDYEYALDHSSKSKKR